MNIDRAIEVLERHKALSHDEREAAVSDPASPFHEAKAITAKAVAALNDADKATAEEERRKREEQRLRNDRIRALKSALAGAHTLLLSIDSASALDSTKARRVAELDSGAAQLIVELGIESALAAPDYSAAVSAWLRCDRSALAAARQAQADAILGALQ